MTETIGQQLHRARLERGLTLEQVEQSTRVRVYYLKALEEDDYLSLPSMVQGRGFLRIYAGFLGLDPVSLLSSWNTNPQENTPAPLQTPEISTGSFIGTSVDLTPAKPAKKPRKSKTAALDEETPANDLPVEEPQIPAAPPSIPPVPSTALYQGAPARQSQPDLDSNAIFSEIGQQLAQQRKLLGLSLADVERYTRLRLHYLEALESGNVDDLPSPVQGRGMLNNYAHFLNLDSEALLFRYADGLQVRRMERMGAQPHRKPATQVTKGQLVARRFLSFDLVIGSSLIILLVAFIIWGTSQVLTAQRQATVIPSVPPISDVLLSTGTEGVLTGEGTPEATSAQSTGTQQPTQVGGFTGSLNFTPLPAGNDPIQIYVIVRQTAWMRVIEDGETTFEGRAQSGSAYPFSGTAQVELITGNAAAFQVYFNQTDLGSLGSEGQVIDLIFDPNGLVLPTATTTPTVTNTAPVTETPAFTLTSTPSATPGLPPINTPNPSLVPTTNP